MKKRLFGIVVVLVLLLSFVMSTYADFGDGSGEGAGVPIKRTRELGDEPN